MQSLLKQLNWLTNISEDHNMPVQINEVIIRAIITTDDKTTGSKTTGGEETHDHEEKKIDMLELIDELLKSKKER
jgi:Family of unknown function (DUF5908)